MKLLEAFKLTRPGDIVSLGHVQERVGSVGLDAQIQGLVADGLVAVVHPGDASRPGFYLTDDGWAEVSKIQQERPMQIAIDDLSQLLGTLNHDANEAERSLREYGEAAVACKDRIARLRDKARQVRSAIALLEGNNA